MNITLKLVNVKDVYKRQDHGRTHHSSSVLETIMVTKRLVIIKYEKTVFNI